MSTCFVCDSEVSHIAQSDAAAVSIIEWCKTCVNNKGNLLGLIAAMSLSKSCHIRYNGVTSYLQNVRVYYFSRHELVFLFLMGGKRYVLLQLLTGGYSVDFTLYGFYMELLPFFLLVVE